MIAGGIYIHIPYCRSRCGYCAFVVTTESSTQDEYLAALESEMDLLRGETVGKTFDSLYLGGGTPSLLPPSRIEKILGVLKERFVMEPATEITLEANPDDIEAEVSRVWKEIGVTRVSVGVQSLKDEELRAVDRRHDSARALRALEILVEARISTSADLLLGLPGQTPDSFRATLGRLLETGVTHVSIYILETGKSKSMEADRRARPQRYLGEDLLADLWLEAGERLERHGFEHYEISNWARAGCRARHNVKYWTRAPTLGLGVSAHEFWNERRRANISALPVYMSEVASGRRGTGSDRSVGPEEAQREGIFLGLRLADGVSERKFATAVHASDDVRLSEDVGAWFTHGLLERRGSSIRLTEKGFLLSNEILCRFV